MDFISIDFEIANENMSSACSIGLAYVDNNKIVKEQYFIIKPPHLRFDPSFTAIHGITKSDVIGKKSFDEVWELIKDDITSNLIVAHNAQFDMSVLSSCLQHYSIAIPSFSYMCSIPISTRACGGNKVGQSLKERCRYFGIEIAEHHHAGADARACAELVIASVKSKDKSSLQTYHQIYSTIPVKEFTELKAQTTFQKKRPKKPKFNAISISEVTAKTETFNKEHILYEKNIVFTGDLLSMDRKEAMQKTVDVGGVIKSGVSSKTNYVVVGAQDPKLVGTAGISTKEKKAKELKDKGINIEIIHEETFIKLLNNKV
ncbi:exonuclease domain-containing protein [Niallia nealsonii]|uniref:Exonuclease n=1 Tax=Niallia nealsonii TaxID=115979 RepID=A0A2N0Z804_9BACI|nr:exonuclease domain-containing protein [Niallia nealsonii]PKG25645.1 exonuclease [Niallia nealsonii]